MISVTPQLPLETKFLDTAEGIQGNVWEVEVIVGDKVVLFKVDTGAEVTVISEVIWKSLNWAT